MARVLFITAAAYLLGSIPFGYLLVRIFRGEDVRLTGSGNIGATNVSRKSPTLGLLTLLLDGLKGSAAVAVGILLSPAILGRISIPGVPWRAILPASSPDFVIWAALAALFAVVGHMFPFWLKFHGGKGVATSLGAFVMIAPKSVLASVLIFIVLVAILRYVSLGSIAAVAAFPNLVMRLHEYGSIPWALLMMALTSALIVLKHYPNIVRLLAGTENRIGRKTDRGAHE
jgi:glycerol-3-phosphate acyltransferase PlsY